MKLAKTITVLAILSATAGCNSNESIVAFAKSADQMSDLLPRVAALPFTACLEQHVFQQIGEERGLPDRAAAAKDCTIQGQARDRVSLEYGVLVQYLQALGKLAAGGSKTPAYGKSISTAAAKLDGLNSAHQAQVSGLAGIIVSAYLHGRTSHALEEAITAADPHVQSLCKAFTTEVARDILSGLQVEEDQLRDLYSDDKSSGPLRMLLARQFDTDQSQIMQNRESVRRYASVLEKIATAHAKLYANRNRLSARDTAEDMAASQTAIATDLKEAGK